MKIILFSDIHANWPAFEKALARIDEEKPDAIYCLGDLVGYNVWPNEVIDEIRRRGIATIAGNHDAKVKGMSEDKLNEPGKNFAYKIITEENKRYLATLPAHIRVEYKINNTVLTILLVHGSPFSNEEYLLEDKPESEFIDVFKNAKADILCFGHSHKPYYRKLIDVNIPGKVMHAINTGSVGKPKDGNPQSGFVILNLEYDGSISMDVQFIRFDYDINKAMNGIHESSIPNEFADMLLKSY